MLTLDESLGFTNPLRAGLQVERTPEPCIVIVAGATGDLAHRKLVPALYRLAQARLLPGGFTVVGIGRSALTDDAWRDSIRDSLAKENEDTRGPVWESFAQGLFYQAVDSAQAPDW